MKTALAADSDHLSLHQNMSHTAGEKNAYFKTITVLKTNKKIVYQICSKARVHKV